MTGILICLMSLSALLHGRETIPLETDWKFQNGDPKGAEKPAFDDNSWQEVTLPHDWSIAGKPNQESKSGGGGGFFPTGIGWYRYTLDAPDYWMDKTISLNFEGVYQNARVWVNGQEITHHPYGYTPFQVDLTPHLELGNENVLAVRVDNSDQPNSRWYSGSGIFRPVNIQVTDPVHIAPDGLFVSTWDVYPSTATMNVKATALNSSKEATDITVEVHLINPEGVPVADSQKVFHLKPNEAVTYNPRLPIAEPRLWSPDSPVLYKAVARVFIGRRLADRVDTRFGIREIEASAKEGFLLNEKPIELFGSNVHHDYGPLGATAYEDAAYRKVRILKEAGFNAVRTAHNPPSTAFLNACDELGLLVINEAFDGWAVPKVKNDYSVHFDEYWKSDLSAFIRRDRNHPSVVMWSIGNEVYERAKPEGARIAEKMTDLVHELDDTRPVTAGINGPGENKDWAVMDPIFDAVDVAGYNYELDRYDSDAERVPDRVIYASESYQKDVFRNWNIITNNRQVMGEFIWSGMDYLGESGIGRVFPPDEKPFQHWEGDHFPWHGAACGDIDLIGQRKPVSHYRNIVWDRGEKLYMAVQEPAPDDGEWNLSKWAMRPLKASWTWPEMEEKPMSVEIYSRYPSVRLFKDFDLVEQKEMSAENEFKAVVEVPYSPGTLKVEGLNENGEVMETMTLKTAGKPARINMTPDRDKVAAKVNELIFVEVAVQDRGGNWQPNAEIPVSYRVEGPAEIIAVGSADLTNSESYTSTRRKTHTGRALVVLRSTGKPGDALLFAESKNLVGDAISIQFPEFPQ